MDNDSITRMAARVRQDILTMIYQSGDGHPAPSLSCVDIVTALYFGVMRVDPADPRWAGRDRLVLSKGHACPAVYAALANRGFFSRDEYPRLRTAGSILQGHPDMKKTPGIDMTAGSLGNGLAAGAGMALAARLSGLDFRTYVICGDGELGEGVIWEAAQLAPKYGLGNLQLFIDNNGMQSGGPVGRVGGVTNIAGKFRAFDWEVLEIDGHDIGAILAAVEYGRSHPSLPTCAVARTVKGKGVSFMENDNAWHKRTPSAEQYAAAMKELGGCL